MNPKINLLDQNKLKRSVDTALSGAVVLCDKRIDKVIKQQEQGKLSMIEAYVEIVQIRKGGN